MQKTPRVGIAALVWRDGKLILMQRWGSHGEGTWSVPGGHLEFGESWEEAAEREVMEEAGVSIKNVKLLAVTNDIFEQENKHYITIWMEADWKSGEAKNMEPEKCKALEWGSIQDLPQPLFQPCWDNLRKTKPELFA
jgi:8-oxo-dGTP diphosphatase